MQLSVIFVCKKIYCSQFIAILLYIYIIINIREINKMADGR